MKNNPYQTPKADLALEKRQPMSSLWLPMVLLVVTCAHYFLSSANSLTVSLCFSGFLTGIISGFISVLKNRKKPSFLLKLGAITAVIFIITLLKV